MNECGENKMAEPLLVEQELPRWPALAEGLPEHFVRPLLDSRSV